ncbi:hypothetical protein TNCT_406301 [Trichonephila clavata]|uniref:Uncharacterized protein n=1 Tax=Trichonephila clavata TaxID=2740835 RepID=A0A8X6KMR9_TRICU|nr:hypothetical protein TNCT_406301 [Trichonephila clavata]
MLNDIALWPTTLTDLRIGYIIRKKPNNIGNIEKLKSVYKDQVYNRGLSYDHFYRKKTNGVKEERNRVASIFRNKQSCLLLSLQTVFCDII